MNDARLAAICETLPRPRTETMISNQERGGKNIRLPVPLVAPGFPKFVGGAAVGGKLRKRGTGILKPLTPHA